MSNATYNPKEMRNYKFRIYPTKAQEATLTHWLTLCRIYYNSALADRKNHYTRNGKGLTRIKQQVTLKFDKGIHNELKEVHSHQECSRCGAIVKKDLAQRVHQCPHCGLVLDRDHNSALVLEKRAS